MKPTSKLVEHMANTKLSKDKKVDLWLEIERKLGNESVPSQTRRRRLPVVWEFAGAVAGVAIVAGGFIWEHQNLHSSVVASNHVANTSNAVSMNNTTMEPSPQPTAVKAFDEAKYWVNPNVTPYKSGVATVPSPDVPSAFEQTVRPKDGVASILVSGGTGQVEVGKPWTQEIQYKSYSFAVNGQTYTVPTQYNKQQILVLPIDSGIVWAHVDPIPGMGDVDQALQGATDIYYTPYLASGGSLATGAQRIAELPHRWMGIDGPVVASAWTGWLPQNEVEMPTVKSDTSYRVNSQSTTATPVKGTVAEWPMLFQRDFSKPEYYPTPHYASYVSSLTRTNGGFVLAVGFVDATRSGRNAGLASATYYWSERTNKWTPLAQNYSVQTLASWTDVGSNGVYWIQPSPINGPDNPLCVTEMHFDPASRTIHSIWLGDWLYGATFVNGNAWVTVLPKDMPTSATDKPKQWTVYSP